MAMIRKGWRWGKKKNEDTECRERRLGRKGGRLERESKGDRTPKRGGEGNREREQGAITDSEREMQTARRRLIRD